MLTGGRSVRRKRSGHETLSLSAGIGESQHTDLLSRYIGDMASVI